MKKKKQPFKSLAEKNAVMERILCSTKEKSAVLLLGHTEADEDCIASLVSVALVLAKFGKRPIIYMNEPFPDQMLYMLNICLYNKIPVLRDSSEIKEIPDAIFFLDIPKPSMISADKRIEGFFGKTLMTEIDHHIDADAAYCGQEGFCYVDNATSTCELLSVICWKLSRRKSLLEEYGIKEFFPRNLALCLLTGIIGDTKSGTTLKTNKEKFFYKFFTDFFTKILRESYRKNSGNYTNVADIFFTLNQFPQEEREVYEALMPFAQFSLQTGAIFLSEDESAEFLKKYDQALFVKVIKLITDYLAEQSGKVGVTSYYDSPGAGGKIQYRIRAAQGWSGVDFRKILDRFNITDGGGHPGAVGFRLKASETNEAEVKAFNESLITELDAL